MQTWEVKLIVFHASPPCCVRGKYTQNEKKNLRRISNTRQIMDVFSVQPDGALVHCKKMIHITSLLYGLPF